MASHETDIKLGKSYALIYFKPVLKNENNKNPNTIQNIKPYKKQNHTIQHRAGDLPPCNSAWITFGKIL